MGVVPEGRELPVAIICMSPWADMASEGESHTYNRFNDPMFGVKSDEPNDTTDSSSLIASYRGETDPYNKYLSPVYSDFTGFPAMLLQVGTYEVLESDSITIFGKAQASGVDVTLTKYRGMFHMFQLLGNILPEGKRAWNEVESFLSLYFAEAIAKEVSYERIQV
jgi:acetyl esterase/lipase